MTATQWMIVDSGIIMKLLTMQYYCNTLLPSPEEDTRIYIRLIVNIECVTVCAVQFSFTTCIQHNIYSLPVDVLQMMLLALEFKFLNVMIAHSLYCNVHILKSKTLKQ